MTVLATFSERGFRVAADNAVDYIAGVQAAGAGQVAANVRKVGSVLHADMESLENTVVAQTQNLTSVVGKGLDHLQILSGLNLAVSAAGFAVVAHQLHAARGDLKALHADIRTQGEALLRAQEAVSSKIETLSDLAARSLRVQEEILDALLRSRTVEAEQLVRQGWANLGHGYVDEADERFRAALVHDNTHVLAHGALGEICAKRGDKVRAEDHLLRAVHFAGPDQVADATRRWAGYLEGDGRPEEALAAWEALPAPNARDHFQVAELAAQSGRRDVALAAVLQALESDPAVFAAVIGSEVLAVLEPDRTRRLMEIDGARRAAALDLLEHVCEPLERIDRVVAFAMTSDAPGVRSMGAGIRSTATALRARGEHVLRQVVTSDFSALEPALQHGTTLLLEVRQLERDTVARTIAAITQPVHAAETALDRARNSSVLTDALPAAAASRVRQVGALLPWGRKDEGRRAPVTGAAVDAQEARRRAVADAVNELRSAHAATGIDEFGRAAETCGVTG